MDCVGNQDRCSNLPHTTHTYIMVDMRAHTDTLTHSYTLIYHHTLPFNSGRSQSHPRSVLVIKEVSSGSGEKTKAFVSLSSTTTTVCSRTRPTPSYFFKPGANVLNCHSHKTAHIEIKSLIRVQNSSYLHSTMRLHRPNHDVLHVYEEPHPGEVNNNCMQPSMNDHSLLT